MAPTQQTFDIRLMEKLIPWVTKPISEHAITALASEYNAEKKSELKSLLLSLWKTEERVMDHRSICRNTVKVSFGRYTHHIAARAMGEFARQKKLYDNCYTVGLKQSVDDYAAVTAAGKMSLSEECLVSGWRLDPTKVKDFRRRNGERLILVSPVVASIDGKLYKGKTANISNGGCLVCFAKTDAPPLEVDAPVSLAYNDLCRRHGLESQSVRYQVVNVDFGDKVLRVALKRVDKDSKAEFDQLIAHLMNGHKRRNKLDVDNTVKALNARLHNLTGVAQLNSLMVLSHHVERYHLLVSQGQSLQLQAELQIAGDMIPYMVEKTEIKTNRLFFAWADNRHHVHMAELGELTGKGHTASILANWKTAVWSKAFLLKADTLDPQLAELGTSLPCDVAPIVSKLNAPLPVKVARLSKELAKMTLIDDITYIIDPIVHRFNGKESAQSDLSQYRLKPCKGQLRQVPFDKAALPNFEGTYRFGHDCLLRIGNREFVIVNGYADTSEAVISLPLSKHDLAVGDEAVIVWCIDGAEIILDAVISNYDVLHHSTTIKWVGEPGLVRAVLKELEILCVFNPAFTADLQANKLDSALRNLILSNLPKVSIFAKVRQQAISLTGMTGMEYLNDKFIDESARAKLDLLFSPQILQKMAMGNSTMRDVLLVSLIEDKNGELLTERVLLSEFDDPKQFQSIYAQLATLGELHVFFMDATQPRHRCEDAIINIEYKYVTHYSPAKAKRLDEALAFDLCIQMVEITEIFEKLMD